MGLNAKFVICTECWVNEEMNDAEVFRAASITLHYIQGRYGLSGC
jgi:hypothetical protein